MNNSAIIVFVDSIIIAFFIVGYLLNEAGFVSVDYYTLAISCFLFIAFAYLQTALLSGVLSIISLFIMTISISIFGRIFSYLLYSEMDYYTVTLFYTTTISSLDSVNLLLTIGIIIYSILLGYFFTQCIENKNKNVNVVTYNLRLPNGPVLFLVGCLVFPYIYSGLEAVNSGGYLSFYTKNLELLEKGSIIPNLYSLGITIATVFLSISISTDNKKNTNFYLCVLLMNSLMLALIGQRGPLLSFFLFYLWYRNKYIKKIPLLRLVIIGGIAIVFSQTLLLFRADYSNSNINLFEHYFSFLFQQGVTLHVIYFTKYIDNFPVYLLAQNFIPGANAIYNMFAEHTILYNSSSAYLSDLLNPALFKSGYGVGWSFVNDIVLLCNKNVGAMIIVACLFGVFLSLAENRGNSKGLYITALSVITAYRIGFLPRAGLNGIFPLWIYSLVIITLLMVLKKKWKN
ncbi:O185 family O-antigen polymerase [Escherichia coli]